jgi:hypothetical protein
MDSRHRSQFRELKVLMTSSVTSRFSRR